MYELYANEMRAEPDQRARSILIVDNRRREEQRDFAEGTQMIRTRIEDTRSRRIRTRIEGTRYEVNRESLIRTRLLVTQRRERSSIDH